MPLRFAGTVDGRPVRLLLTEGRHVLGSSAVVDLRVEHPTVSRRHAELVVENDRVEVRDLGSRNGVWVGNRRVENSEIAAGTPVAFGKVWLMLEEVPSLDLDLGLAFTDEPGGRDSAPGEDRAASTVTLRMVEAFALETLPRLLTLADGGAGELALARAAARALASDLPTIRVEVVPSGADGDGVVFQAQREELVDAPGVEIDAAGLELAIRVVVPGDALATQLTPLVDSIGALLRLSASGEPRVARTQTPEAPRLPEPPTLVPAVRRIYEQAARVAQGDVGILVCGESGTGKEVFARYLHAASPRAASPFIALNCAALPHDLLEAELFGIERGVATGVEARPGKLELAHGGTLLLDEIADMALETQGKILRALQEGEIYRLGGATPRPARCRVVAATNREVEDLRSTGRFREDLYYRIASWVVEMPPLRHRRADIPNLAAHFLLEAAAERGLKVRGISRRTLDVMSTYLWPGNIRQLENEMARAALFLDDGDVLEASRLSPEILAGTPREGTTRLEERLAETERREILRALGFCNGVAKDAAEHLGISRSTLYRRMRGLGIEAESG